MTMGIAGNTLDQPLYDPETGNKWKFGYEPRWHEEYVIQEVKIDDGWDLSVITVLNHKKYFDFEWGSESYFLENELWVGNEAS